MIVSASSRRSSCPCGSGQSMPSGASFRASPEPTPRNARPGFITSSVAMNWATSAG